MVMFFSLESGVYFVDKVFLVLVWEEWFKECLVRNILYSLFLLMMWIFYSFVGLKYY